MEYVYFFVLSLCVVCELFVFMHVRLCVCVYACAFMRVRPARPVLAYTMGAAYAPLTSFHPQAHVLSRLDVTLEALGQECSPQTVQQVHMLFTDVLHILQSLLSKRLVSSMRHTRINLEVSTAAAHSFYHQLGAEPCV
jgi:hypothetical protein